MCTQLFDTVQDVPGFQCIWATGDRYDSDGSNSTVVEEMTLADSAVRLRCGFPHAVQVECVGMELYFRICDR